MASKSIYRPVLHQLSTASRIRSQHVHNSMRFRPDSLHVPTCSIKMMSSSARVSHLAYTNGYPIQSAKQSPATNAADTLLPGFSTVGIIIFPGAQETLRTLLQHIPPDLPHTAIQGVLLHYLKSWNLENQEPKMETITETQPVAKHEVASQKGLQNRVLDIIERSIDHKVGGYIGDEMDVQSKIYQDVVMELVRGGFVMPFGNPVRASGPIRALKSGSIAQSAINKARFSTGPGPTGKVSVCTDILTKMLEDHQSSWLRNLKEYNLIYTTSLNVMEYSWSSAATEAIDLNLIKTQLWHKGVSLCPIQSEKLDGKYLEVLRCHLETLGIPGNAKLHVPDALANTRSELYACIAANLEDKVYVTSNKRFVGYWLPTLLEHKLQAYSVGHLL